MNKNIGYLLSKASISLKLAISQRLQPYNLTSTQWAMLKNISLYESGTTPAQIAEQMGAERPTITGILDRLKAKQFIISQPHPQDKRSQLISLTLEGSQLVKELDHLADTVLEESLRGISAEQQAILTFALQQIIINTKGNDN